LQHPERNREVVVFTLNNMQHDGHMYDCFEIMLRVNGRVAVLTDQCTAFVVSEQEMLILYPFVDPLVLLAQADGIHNVSWSPQRVMKQLLLRFPNTVRLANVFNNYSHVITTTLTVDYITPTMPIADVLSSPVDGPMQILTAYVQWRIADMNTYRKTTMVAAVATPM
jgi:hypothetical protein